MGLTIFHVLILDISHIQFDCGKYPEILCGLLSVPQNIVKDLNNVMFIIIKLKPYKYMITSILEGPMKTYVPP